MSQSTTASPRPSASRCRSPLAAAAIAGATALTAMNASVGAQVYGLVMQYQAIYLQNSSAAPTTTTSHQFSSSISFPAQNMPVIDEIRVQKPGGAEVPTSGSDTFYTTGTTNYATRAALMAAWPSGPYTYIVAAQDEDENVVETSYVLQQPSAAGAWPAGIPAFTATSYAALQNVNPAQPLTLEIDPLAISPPAITQMNGLTINQRFGTAQGPGVFSGLHVGGAPVFTKTVPANTLLPNTDYYASWIFEPRIQNPPPPGVSYTHIAFGNLTRVAFRTGPAVSCPADLGVQGGGAGQDNQLDNNDFIAFITHFFSSDPRADMGVQGGGPGTDGQFDNNDFIAFINLFFAGC